ARHAELDRIIEAHLDAVLEFADAARIAGETAVAGGPVAGREIVQHQLQLVALQASQDLFGLEHVGEQEFDRVEAGRTRRGKAFEEAELVEKQTQVGGKFRHGGSVLMWIVRYRSRSRAAPSEHAARCAVGRRLVSLSATAKP